MAQSSWIKTELSQHFTILKDGVDLDGNGRISGSEKADLNDDGRIDELEWVEFLNKNKSSIPQQQGIFKYYYSLRPNNPIHKIISIESQSIPNKWVLETYKLIIYLHDSVKEFERSEKEAAEYAKSIGLDTPKFKYADAILRLNFVAREIQKRGFLSKGADLSEEEDDDNEGVIRLVAGVRDKDLDCDTGSFLLLAVGHERAWPVSMILLPNHAYLRWAFEDGDSFNFDIGLGGANLRDYRRDWEENRGLRISPASIAKGVYLTPLTEKQVNSTVYASRGIEKFDQGKYKEALPDLEAALRLWPNNVRASEYMCRALVIFDEPRKALPFCSRTIELDPFDEEVTVGLAELKNELGYPKESVIEDYEKVLRFNPNSVDARNGIFVLSGLTLLSKISLRIDNQAVGARSSMGLVLPITFLYPLEELELGMGAELGISANNEGPPSVFDPSLGFNLRYRPSVTSSLGVSVGIGHYLTADGSEESAPNNVAFLQSGIGYSHRITGDFELGASVSLQNEFRDFENWVVLPGLSASYCSW